MSKTPGIFMHNFLIDLSIETKIIQKFQHYRKQKKGLKLFSKNSIKIMYNKKVHKIIHLIAVGEMSEDPKHGG